MIWWHILLVVIISYFIGNISNARFIASMHKMDITKLGSGNPGTTNILRNFGFKWGLFSLILDVLKGLVPVLTVFYIFGGNNNENISVTMEYISGISVIVGHIFPILYKFKGGKGMASSLGVLFAVDPIFGAIVLIVAAIVWLLFKYGSLACFVIIIAFTVIEALRVKGTYYMFGEPYFNISLTNQNVICLILFGLFILTWFAERKNIERLLIGKESKVDLIKSVNKKIKRG